MRLLLFTVVLVFTSPALAQAPALLHTLESPNPEENGSFGRAITRVPDFDVDGIDDLFIGSAETTADSARAGRAYLFSGRSGTLLRTLESPNPETQGGFGVALSAVPDTNGDNIPDLLVGASRENARTGRAYLFDGKTGSLMLSVQSPNPEPYFAGCFGRSAVGVRDVDGDGGGDLLVGSFCENDLRGHAYLFSDAPSGVYLVRVEAGSAVETRRVTLVR